MFLSHSKLKSLVITILLLFSISIFAEMLNIKELKFEQEVTGKAKLKLKTARIKYKRNPEEGLKLYQEVLTEMPSNIEANIYIANNLLFRNLKDKTVQKDLNDYVEASKYFNVAYNQAIKEIEKINELINKKPKKAKKMQKYIDAFEKEKQYANERINYCWIKIYNNANVEFKNGNYENSLGELDKLKEIIPADSTNVILLQARNYGKLGDQEKMKEYYAKALEKDPLNEEVNITFSNMYIEKNDYKSALPYLLKVEQIKPDNVNNLYNISLAYDALGDQEKRIAYLQKMIEIAPDDPDAITNLALYYAESNQTDKALIYFNKLIEMDPSDNNFAYICSKLSDAKMYKELYEVSSKWLEKSPDNESAKFLKEFSKSKIK